MRIFMAMYAVKTTNIVVVMDNLVAKETFDIKMDVIFGIIDMAYPFGKLLVSFQ